MCGLEVAEDKVDPLKIISLSRDLFFSFVPGFLSCAAEVTCCTGCGGRDLATDTSVRGQILTMVPEKAEPTVQRFAIRTVLASKDTAP